MTERILEDHVALRSALATAELPKTGGRAFSQLTLTLSLYFEFVPAGTDENVF